MCKLHLQTNIWLDDYLVRFLLKCMKKQLHDGVLVCRTYMCATNLFVQNSFDAIIA